MIINFLILLHQKLAIIVVDEAFKWETEQNSKYIRCVILQQMKTQFFV